VLGTFPTALVYFMVYDRTSAALEALYAKRPAPALASLTSLGAGTEASASGALDVASSSSSSGGPAGGVSLPPQAVARRRASDAASATHERAAGVHLLSAAAGAIASSVVRVPGDTIRHQTQAYMHRNVFAAAFNILSARGVAGLYLGYLPTLLRDVPELAIQFTCYEALRKGVTTFRAEQAARERAQAQSGTWSGRRRQQAMSGRSGGMWSSSGNADGGEKYKLATWEHLILGGLAGAAAATVTMPLDFVKTRQQCGAGVGVLGLVRGVIATEGIGGLFSGLAPRVCHVAMTSSVFFGLFEGTKLLLKPQRTEDDRPLLPKIMGKRRDHVWKRQLVLE
jgi:hypothetical protein